MVRSLPRLLALLFLVFSLTCCARGFRAGSGVYITKVKISSMPKPAVVAPVILKVEPQSAPATSSAIVASAAAPLIVR